MTCGKQVISTSEFDLLEPRSLPDTGLQNIVSLPALLESCAGAAPPAPELGMNGVALLQDDDFVVSEGGLDAGKLRDFCREQLTGYKVPRCIEFRPDLPRSNVGKILRRE